MSSVTAWARSWGLAAVTTIAALIAFCVAGGVSVALFWATTYNEPGAMKHTLVLFAIVTDIALIVLIAAALYRAYRRPS